MRKDQRTSIGSAKWLLAAIVLTTVGFAAVCGGVLQGMRRASLELARQSSVNLASTMDGDIARNIELFDLSLRAAATNYVLPEIQEVSAKVRDLILFDHAAKANHFGALKIYDAAGTLVIEASSRDVSVETVKDAPYFSAQVERDAGLYIDRPSISKGGEYMIVLSRRITNPDGTFGGIAAGSIKLSYFHDLFRRVDVGEDGAITLVRRDGVVLMRVPFDLAAIGTDLNRGPGTRRLLSGQGGSFEGRGAVDNIPRQFVWSDGKQPLVIIVGKSLTSIYGPWRSEAIRIASLLAVLAIVAFGSVMFTLREMHKREAAELRLASLAETDGLTGLKNRRSFDAAMEAEWERSARQKTPLALLMIDADFFKAYNDKFGHQAGDKALMGIAACITANVRRAGDCAARYGGEEFAVILPGLTASEAKALAERVRKDVELLPLEQSAVTISIGIASTIPTRSRRAAALIREADAALYISKEDGRNRCSIAVSATPLVA